MASTKSNRACAYGQAPECALCLHQIDGRAALLVIADDRDVATAPVHVRCAIDLLAAMALPGGFILTRPFSGRCDNFDLATPPN